MLTPNIERAGIKTALLLSIAAVTASCTTPEEPIALSSAASSNGNDSAFAATYCDGLATTPNDRLWQAINEASTVTTDIREIADGSTRYCINVSISNDPLVLGSSSCAPTPDQVIATFAHEYAAYLCGVTND